jgi:hypothetical protein
LSRLETNNNLLGFRGRTRSTARGGRFDLRLKKSGGTALASLLTPMQEQLTEMAGTSRATVNRVLREEEARGNVELRRGRTAVLDAEAITRWRAEAQQRRLLL